MDQEPSRLPSRPGFSNPLSPPSPAAWGLGLSITYELAQRHHGRTPFESRENQGAAFVVWLPVVPPDRAQP
jgi:signal transduction histidine kinase